MKPDNSVPFNQIRNYRKCITDAVKIVSHFPPRLVKRLCIVWGLSAVALAAMLYLFIWSTHIMAFVFEVFLLLAVLLLQSTGLVILGRYVSWLKSGSAEATFGKFPLRKTQMRSILSFLLLRVGQVLFLLLLVAVMQWLGASAMAAQITAAVVFAVIAYFDVYLVGNSFLQAGGLKGSAVSAIRCCLKHIGTTFLIYVTTGFFILVAVVVFYTPTFILACGMGAQKFSVQIGDSPVSVSLWAHFVNIVLIICAFVVTNALFSISRMAAVLFENSRFLSREEMAAQAKGQA